MISSRQMAHGASTSFGSIRSTCSSACASAGGTPEGRGAVCAAAVAASSRARAPCEVEAGGRRELACDRVKEKHR